MNLSFIAGLVIAILVVVLGVAADGTGLVFANLSGFWNPTGLIITFGGTLAVLIASHPLSMLTDIPLHFKVILRRKQDQVFYVDIMTELSYDARKKGIMSLEENIAGIDDNFLRQSVRLLIDGTDPEKAREKLNSELVNIENRHASAAGIYDKGAALAPAFGMIGTVIGLINMLGAMGIEDAGGFQILARSMMLALVTIFYGLILANAFFVPIASQLRMAHEQEMICKEIVIEGIISIQAGENPRHIHDKLLSYLTEEQRERAGGDDESD